MEIHIDYFSASNFAVLLLTFIGGLAFSILIRFKGIAGCITYLLAAVVISVIVVALIKGYSYLLEDVTYYLTEYIYYNSVGLVGFLLGFVVGLFIKKSRGKAKT